MDIGLLLLRLAVGLTIAAHGAQMLSGWFGGQGLAKTGQLFEALGFPPGRSYALLPALAEIGGVLLASGLATPLSAAIIFAVMIVAAFSAHLKQGFFITSGGLRVHICSVCRSLDTRVYRSWFTVSGRATWPLVEWCVVGAGCHTGGYPCQYRATRSKTTSICKLQMICATIDLR
jgi:putative oxidoreductase